MATEMKQMVEANGRVRRIPQVNGALTGMPAASARGLAISGSVLALTGILLGVFRYLLPSTDAFSAYPHPWWKTIIMLHVLATPVFFFFVGSIWWRHAVRHWKTRERRLSGIFVVASMVTVAATGYLLYFVGGERSLAVLRLGHAVTGVLVTVVYAHHAIMGWRAMAARRRAVPPLR